MDRWRTAKEKERRSDETLSGTTCFLDKVNAAIQHLDGLQPSAHRVNPGGRALAPKFPNPKIPKPKDPKKILDFLGQSQVTPILGGLNFFLGIPKKKFIPKKPNFFY